MINVTLPDGSKREFDQPISGFEFAESISKSLAKKAIALKVDGQMKDLSTEIASDVAVEVITKDTDDGVEVLRHDAAHVLAQAVQELFPGTQVTIGPVIEHGFYYDFAREESFSEADLEQIEVRMKEIVDRDLEIIREVWTRDKAIAHFKEIGEHYKAEIIENLPADEEISVYRQGEWLDLCVGPHLPSTGKLGKAFKLTKLAGAYWRGDSNNEMLQRIYGTAWASEKELKAHLHMLEEAEKRDHRRLGREMDLFHIQEEAKGMIFWHPRGWRLYRTVLDYVRRRIEREGYVEVKTPQIMDRSLWEKSGHWEKFRDNMFVANTEEGETLAVKPMNCPGHIQIFNQGIKSYRDLPLKYAEFDGLHRCEASGALHGAMRVRQMAQDDAHIFCTEDQVEGETRKFIELLNLVYEELEVELHSVKLALRPDVRAGTDEVWDLAESQLEKAAIAAGVEVEKLENEGAFYGPKLEFHLRDAIGRTWQCGTLQLDFVLPERLDANYIGEDGEKHRPVMLHRAILGSMERFLGILIEHHAGKFPLWLAPRQVVVATITSEAEPYAREVMAEMEKAGLLVDLDVRNEKINYKVREHSVGKVPVIAVVGKKEAEDRAVSLRRLGQKDQKVVSLDQAIKDLVTEATPPDLR